jgi:hypothetical protein
VGKGGAGRGTRNGSLNFDLETIMQKFHLTPRYKLLYSLVGVLSSLPFLVAMYWIWRVPVFNVFLFIIILLAEVRFFYWIRKENISVSDAGIMYDTPGMILEVKWEDIQKISHCWRFLIRQECLIVDQSRVKIKGWAIYANTYSRPFEKYFQSIAIPLTSLSDNWRDSELGQQIKQYAPHLFQ